MALLAALLVSGAYLLDGNSPWFTSQSVMEKRSVQRVS